MLRAVPWGDCPHRSAGSTSALPGLAVTAERSRYPTRATRPATHLAEKCFELRDPCFGGPKRRPPFSEHAELGIGNLRKAGAQELQDAVRGGGELAFAVVFVVGTEPLRSSSPTGSGPLRVMDVAHPAPGAPELGRGLHVGRHVVRVLGDGTAQALYGRRADRRGVPPGGRPGSPARTLRRALPGTPAGRARAERCARAESSRCARSPDP